MIKLTKRQSEILDFLKSRIEDTGYPPTRVEIATEFGFKSPNAAEEHLKALAKKGAIEMVPGTSRGIRLPCTESEGLPVIGQVAAGDPILAEQNIEEYCPLPSQFFHPAANYLLRVKGLSMKDIGILDGDLIAVHKTEQARNGQIIVARIGEEVTVKRFQKERQKITLFPENKDFNPIHVDANSEPFQIEGISVGIIRRN